MMSQNFNQSSNSQNFQNQNMSQNMNNNNDMYNSMNYMNMDNELLKCVMEGMGEQPSDDMAKNWDTIMNFVPKLDSCNFSQNLGIGKVITLIFNYSTGDKKRFKIGEDTPLKDVFYEFGKANGIDNNTINKWSFLFGGKKFDANSSKTLKEEGFRDQSNLVIFKP